MRDRNNGLVISELKLKINCFWCAEDGDYDFKIKIAGDVEAAKKMISPALTKLPPLDEDLEDVSPMEVDDEEVVDREKEEEDVSAILKISFCSLNELSHCSEML